MFGDFKYNAEDAVMPEFEMPTPGAHRVRIVEAEESISKNTNKPMMILKLEVAGFPGTIFHYLVMNNDNKDVPNKSGVGTHNPYLMTQQSLGQIYDSFEQIKEGDLNVANWVGKTGAAMIAIEAYEKDGLEKESAKIKYFLGIEQQRELAPWSGTVTTGTATAAPAETEKVDSKGLDFSKK